MRDLSEEEEVEHEAKETGYILRKVRWEHWLFESKWCWSSNGNCGRHPRVYGGEPANFLDVGGESY